MNTRTAHPRVRRVATVSAVVVAGSLAGVVGAGALSAGGSPRSTPPVDPVELSAIADFAVDEGLTGLSPAHLYPVED